MPDEYVCLYGYILEVIKIYNFIKKEGIRGKAESQDDADLEKKALRDSILMTLYRNFDSHKDSCHLLNFLKDSRLDDDLMKRLLKNTSDPVVKKT